VFDLCDYEVELYFVFVMKVGLVKKMCLVDYDFNCSGGLIVINLCDVGVDEDGNVIGD